MIYSYSRIPYFSENEWTMVICSNTNKEHYDELQKQVKEERKSYDFIYTKFKNMQH